MECDVSEYTMSEIIAAVYDLMEDTGVQEGILFRDQLRVRDSGPGDAPVFAVQDFRPPPGAQRLDRGDGGQPAGVQQLRAGVRRGHLGPAQAH